MEPIHKRVAGLDAHRMKHVANVLVEQQDGLLFKQTREFGGFKRDLRALIEWLQEHSVELLVMESTGIYWKSIFAHLEAAGIPLGWSTPTTSKTSPDARPTSPTWSGSRNWPVSGWYGQFIASKDLRELRLVSRYRHKLAGMVAGEKNRLHKLLDDAGIKLVAVVSDIDGLSARKTIEGLLAGQPPEHLAVYSGP
jgi:transposase